MPLSMKVRWIAVLALVVILLAYAANEGLDSTPAPKPTPKVVPRTTYPLVPADIDSNALDGNPQATVSTPKPSATPVPVVRPAVSAEAYLVANLDTGEIYSERRSSTVFPIASLSKLVTALVATHSMQPTQKIMVTQPMLDAFGDAGHLVLNEEFTVSELLYPLLLESSNDAAEGFAQSFGYAAFIAKMNEFVAGLGMTATSFRDASGLSSGNISNSKDLFKLAQYLYKSEPALLDITRQTSFGVASSTTHGSHVWNTINPFPLDPHFIGGKTGRTIEAKESMISLFRYATPTGIYPVAVIVLRSEFSDREEDTSYLFEQVIKKIDKK